MAMVETAAVADFGKAFAEACYTLEGDSAMILRGFAVFRRLEETIGKECDLVNVRRVIDNAYQLICKGREIANLKMNNSKATCDDSENEVNACKETLKTLIQEKKKMKEGTTSSGRKRKLSEKATDHDALERIDEEIIDARVQLKLVKKRHAELEKLKKGSS